MPAQNKGKISLLNRTDTCKSLRDIRWQTKVALTDAQDHLIPVNGERIQGSYGITSDARTPCDDFLEMYALLLHQHIPL